MYTTATRYDQKLKLLMLILDITINLLLLTLITFLLLYQKRIFLSLFSLFITKLHND